MIKSYCVKQKKQTECVEPSGYKQAKNGRLMYFCTCAECGISKTKFVKSQSISGGALVTGKEYKPYCGIGKVPKGKKLGSFVQCYDSGQVRRWGANQIPLNILETLMKEKDFDKKLKSKYKREEKMKKDLREEEMKKDLGYQMTEILRKAKQDTKKQAKIDADFKKRMDKIIKSNPKQKN